ncbi:hypothetical protein Ade02nite_47110 [Paractinoplanes deccanensis]|uniref:Uncharacterized protein n=1 Tax=Paractinoplanes deccanensis TaxID=113561 RepID=A0ABQ3Y7V2_9ACTN|nr:hypothetical protein [Actinoplanes deccanensis]GID76070.1 hypothetical protein Ade02nite_47110 [Actinoplanes deccanensis]
MSGAREEPALRDLRDQLEQAVRSLGDRTVADTVTRMALEAALCALVHGSQALADPEAIHRAAVYGLATEQLAPAVRAPEAAVFRALLELCGEPPDGVLTAAAPAADPAVVTALRRTLVLLTVAYDVGENRSVTRRMEIWSGAAPTGVNRKRIRQEISWDETPAGVRAHRLREGAATQSFQLYP